MVALGSAFLEKKTNEFFEKPHVIEEVLECDWQAWMRQNKNIAPLTKAINVYVHDEVKSKLFAEMIVISAREEKLDPWLVFAVISKESSFNPSAKSYVGARGLMQIMPFWKKEIGFQDDNLFNPKVNISYGTKILRHYIERFETIDGALAAYNGSRGSMKYPLAVRRNLAAGRLAAFTES